MKRLLLTIPLIINLFISQCVLSQSGDINKNPVVIILDVQEDYAKTLRENNSYKPFIEGINKLIDCTDPSRVIYVAALHRALNISTKGFTVDTIVGSNLATDLNIVNNDIIIKTHGNAFKEKELLQVLQNKNAEDVIVAGLLAEKCVYKTLSGGTKKDFNMYVVPDAIIGRTTDSKEKALNSLYKNGINKLSLEFYCSLQ